MPPKTQKKRKTVGENLPVKKSKISAEVAPSFPLTPEALFEWLVSPSNASGFFDQYWEKQPLHVKRNDPDFYGKLFSLDNVEEIFRAHQLVYGENVNVCKLRQGKKVSHNKKGVVKADDLLKAFHKDGCTLQFLQPQQFSSTLSTMNSLLEDFFGCLVGANVYLTPTGAQGLAPHHDDVEVFILQLEGTKHWKLYRPMLDLPRDYSPDLDEADIGEPIMEVELKQGDMLYFPRGTIHQAKTQSDGPSTHITLSTYQNNAWFDFLMAALPTALVNAFKQNIEFRRGLPRQYLDYVGQVHKDTDNMSSMREKFENQLKSLAGQLSKYIDVDTTADVLSTDFVHSRLPPPVPKDDEEGPFGPMPRSENILIKLRHPSRTRMMLETDEDGETFAIVFNSINNSQRHHMNSRDAPPPESLRFPAHFASAIVALFTRQGDFVKISELGLSTADALTLAGALWAESLVETHEI